MPYVAIHIPEFPIAAWRLSSSSRLAGALAIAEGIAPQERIVSMNREAMRAGLAHGMSKSQAEAAGPVTIRGRQASEEEAAFREAMAFAERFSPRVQAIASPANAYSGAGMLAASLLIDAAGTGTLFGDLHQYAGSIRSEFARSGLPANIGAAPNAHAALLFSQSGRNTVCTDVDELSAQLAPLPVSLLPCQPRVSAVLSRWGIRTLGQLAALPEEALVSRLGQEGRHLQQLARGSEEHLLVPEEEPFELTETTLLDSPLEVLESLLFVLSPMLESVMRKAGGRAYAIRDVRVTLQLEGMPAHTVQVRPAVPTQNREALLKLINLELQAHPPQAGIVGLTLQAGAAKPQMAQRGLFQAQFPEPDKLDLLLARLRSIAGEHNVGSPELRNSHRFDAFSMVPFEPAVADAKQHIASETRLALRIFRPAQPVRVTCWAGQPRTLVWQGDRLTIASCAGPWHSSGSWWDGNAWDHDLWDVVTTERVHGLRLMCMLPSQAWFVVGMYD